LNPEGEVTSAPATFAQFRVRLTGTATASPALEYVRLTYQTTNRAPVVKVSEPQVGASWNGEKTISWEAYDADGDDLVYTVFISKDDGKTWAQLIKLSDTDEEEALAGEDEEGTAEDEETENAGVTTSTRNRRTRAPGSPSAVASASITRLQRCRSPRPFRGGMR
jgi:hypothetical protein